MNKRLTTLKKIVRFTAYGLFLCLFVLAPAAYVAGALWYQAPSAYHEIITILWSLYSLLIAAVLLTRYKLAAVGVFIASLAVFALWWASILPRTDRDWAPEVEHIVTSNVDGSQATVYNVRNFTWRTETDYDVSWQTRTYDLDKIKNVELLLSYWGMPAIAHTLIGFEFENGEHLVFSIEIRKENGEQYSNIGGLFRRYELAFIAADERDIVYLRTNVRGEDVYRYPLNMTPEASKKLFASYLQEGQRISAEPAFYNTLTANCTTIVFFMMRAIAPTLAWDPSVFLTGYLPRYLHKLGGPGRDMPLEEMISKARITDKAIAAGHSPDFSKRIRATE